MDIEQSHPLQRRLKPVQDGVIAAIEKVVGYDTPLIDEGLEETGYALAYTHQLSDILFDDPTHAQRQAIYRAYHFAVVLNQLVHVDTTRFGPDPSVSKDATPTEARDELYAIDADFIYHNNALDEVCGMFMPEIDPTGEASTEVGVVISLVSAQIERAHYNKLIEQETEKWDGIVPGPRTDSGR